MKIRLLMVGMLAVSLSASADYKAKTRMTAAGHSFDSTMMVKGARQRTEMQLAPGMAMTTVYQCDLKRSIQINDRNKTYMIMADSDPSEAASPAAGMNRPTRSQRSGGVVTITSNLTETGAKKQILGHAAREIKMNMTMASTPGSCSAANTKMSSDGWYIDLPVAASCASPERAAVRMRAQQSQCRDQFVFKTNGAAKLGYPVNVITTIADEKGSTTTFQQETLELTTTSLDDKLFDIPAGYRQVNSYAALMGMGSIGEMMRQAQRENGEKPNYEDMSGDAGPRKETPDDDDENATRTSRPARPLSAEEGSQPRRTSGRVRIGVAMIADSGNTGLAADKLRDHLTQSLQDLNAEVIDLNENSKGSSSQAIVDAATKQQCDYYLLTEISGVKASSSKRKLGGLLGRATGVSVSDGNSEATFKYRLFALTDTSAHLDTTASAGGDSPESAAPKALDREAGAVMERITKDREAMRHR